MSDFEQALADLTEGHPVLIYDADGREEETDIVYISEFVEPEDVMFMRKNGGGLICTTITDSIATAIGLPFLVDVLECTKDLYPIIAKSLPDNLPYDTKSAFSITINHKNCYTGITDGDRALTISEFGKLVDDLMNGLEPSSAAKHFTDNFRIPGHVFLLRTSREILKDRLDDAMEISEKAFYGPPGTSNGFRDDDIVRRIDYIFANNVKVLSYAHIDDRRDNNRHISDHLPVLAIIYLPTIK